MTTTAKFIADCWKRGKSLAEASKGPATTVSQFLEFIKDLPLRVIERNRVGGLALIPSDPDLDREGQDHLYHALEFRANRKGLRVRRGTLVWTVNGMISEHIVKHGSGYRLLSHDGKNLGDFDSYAAAAKHEGEVKWFKQHESFIPDHQKTKQNAMCITCMGKGTHPEKSPTGKVYSCPSCQGSGISPFKVAAVKG